MTKRILRLSANRREAAEDVMSSYYDSQVALTAIIPERHESGYDDFGESVINL